MSRIKHMIRKEFLQIFRDRPMMAIIFMVPVIQLFILAYAITTDVQHLKLMVIDYDHSRLSREIIRRFIHTRQFDPVYYSRDMREINDKMRAWDVQVAIVIPPDFYRDIHSRRIPQIQVVVDGVDGNSAGVALGYAQSIFSEFGIELAAHPRAQMATQGIHRLEMEERLWYNQELDSKQYMVPGIVVVLLTIIPMMLSAMSLVKEKEIGTLEQLMVTPLRKHQLLLGKIIPFLILSYFELAVVMFCAVMGFDIVMNGSYLQLAFLSFLYLFTTIGLGIFISTFTHSQQQAMFVSWFAMVFMILMSGFFIPIDNMPPVLQKLTYLNPMRYFMYIIRDIFQKGSGIAFLYRDVLPMTVFGLLIFTFGVAKFRKRVG